VVPLPFVAFLKLGAIVIAQAQELSSRPMANSRRFCTDISQGKNEWH